MEIVRVLLGNLFVTDDSGFKFCEVCDDNNDCGYPTSPKPYCLRKLGNVKCVQCLTDKNCKSGESCSGYSCI